MQRIHCSFCQQDDARLVYRVPDRYFSGREAFSIMRCNNCGLLYVNPQPDAQELSAYYPPAYFELFLDKEIPGQRKKTLEKKCQQRLRVIQRFKEKGRVLDIGCADGYFLHCLKREGWEVAGVEPSEFAAKKAKEEYGIPVSCGELLDARYPDNCFDVISLFETLEHVPKPLETLWEIKRILKSDGLLVGTVPNFASLQRRIFSRHWYCVDPPRHLFYFTRNVLCAILEKSGFSSVRIQPTAGQALLGTQRTTGYSESIRVLWNDITSKEGLLGPQGKGPQGPREQPAITLVKKFLHACEKMLFYVPALSERILGSQDTLLFTALKS